MQLSSWSDPKKVPSCEPCAPLPTPQALFFASSHSITLISLCCCAGAPSISRTAPRGTHPHNKLLSGGAPRAPRAWAGDTEADHSAAVVTRSSPSSHSAPQASASSQEVSVLTRRLDADIFSVCQSESRRLHSITHCSSKYSNVCVCVLRGGLHWWTEALFYKPRSILTDVRSAPNCTGIVLSWVGTLVNVLFVQLMQSEYRIKQV